MRISISNIAWDPSEDEAIAELLNRYRIDAIDIAPAKYFPVPHQASDADIAAVKTAWCRRGVQIVGMQALLFGTSGLNVFGVAEVQTAMLKHFEAVCRIAAGLGAERVVFGSPKNRDRNGLSDMEAEAIAIAFFRKLGEIALHYDVYVCLEPNPPCYGANFMTNSIETATVVKKIAHPAIRMQFDLGALTINKEQPVNVLQAYSELIGHIHLSEPDLLPLGDCGTDHRKIAEVIQEYFPNHIATIEMISTKNEPHYISVDRALMVATKHYRSNLERGGI